MTFGILYAALSAFFNGTFGSLGKLQRLRDAEVPPQIFNFWTCIGVTLSSVPLLAVKALVFSWWGLLSGLLFVCSCGAAMAAIQFLGLSIASGVWCGTAVLTSFTYGVLVAGDTLHAPLMAAVSLLLIIVGIAGVATSGGYAKSSGPEPDVEDDNGWQALDDERGHRSGRTWLGGMLVAVSAGLLGGLILAPMKAAPSTAQGLRFVPSMAAGVLLSCPVVTAAASVLLGHWPMVMHSKVAALPGIIAGVLWNLGNMCSILAVQDPTVGLAVGYPIMQCGLFVAGAWGILLFHEMKGAPSAANVMYWASGALIIGGAALLAHSK